MHNYGVHTLLDACVENVNHFNKKDLHKLFRNLAKSLDMEIIKGPAFVEVDLDTSKLRGNTFQDEGGITGYCVISTSHISIHTWELRKFFSMDVFSCKPFEVNKALNVIDNFFKIIESRVTVINRISPKNDKDAFINHSIPIINQNISTTLRMKI